ncbi:MAG: hypothetical protein RIF32_21660 [Leptospirales bacterium]|jgi:hypothetical protein
MGELARSMKIRDWQWFALLLPARGTASGRRLVPVLALFGFALLSCGVGADDPPDPLVELLTYGAVLNETRVTALATDGVGVIGFLPNQEARQRYGFFGQPAGHLLVLYGAPDGSTSLDGGIDLATSAGVSIVSADRRLRGLVERREAILSATQYLVTVRAFTGTFGSYSVAVSAGAVSGGGSCAIGATVCRDYNRGAVDSLARANCAAAGGAFSAAACTTTSRVAQCTTGFFDSGATTVNGYSPGFANAALFQADCLTTFGADQFVFQ